MSSRRASAREVARFRGEEQDMVALINSRLNAAAATIAGSKKGKNSVAYHLKQSKSKLESKLKEAGLESSEAQGKFILIRIALGIGCPIIGFVVGFHYMIPYYATLFTLFMTSMGVALPIMWLKARTSNRMEEIQRELPLVLDLTNLATSAGWDVAAALERVIDALYVEFPEHPLIRELKRARWLIPSGYTWEEALKRVSEKLSEDTVRRTTLALAQAIRQGGDRSMQLEGIAQDAQRIYYSSLDKRLASLPVKALLLTMLLMIAYFIILLAPAAVQIKDIAMAQMEKKNQHAEKK